jgi:hypothetical protein
MVRLEITGVDLGVNVDKNVGVDSIVGLGKSGDVVVGYTRDSFVSMGPRWGVIALWSEFS